MAGITRRRLLVTGGVGAGLVVGWSLWPRRYPLGLAAAPGETVLGAFLKIGEDGRVVVVVPQVEMGQGVWTALPQILADELGADWRTVTVEPALPGPFYANGLVAAQFADPRWPASLEPVAQRLADRWARRTAFLFTGLSTSVRAFEAPLRAAGATARALLCMAAAKRWGIDWRACDAQAGFVVRGDDRLRFAEIAAEAARFEAPENLPYRPIGSGGLSGRPIARLDAPAKVDGSVRFAADVRLPGMVFAAIRQAPPGDSHLIAFDAAAARVIPDLVAILDNPGWIAAVADNWWTANRALDTLAPRFETRGGLPDDASIDRALKAALSVDGARVAAQGDPAPLLGEGAVVADYAAGPAGHAAIETPAATARLRNGRLEVWAATQAPGAARAAAARAIGLSDDAVTLYPMPMGGGFGGGLDATEVAQAAILAARLKRPVQLMWSRVEACLHDRLRPAARARLSARLVPGGIAAWHAAIATPPAVREALHRLVPDIAAGSDGEAVAGAVPPYRIPAMAIDHHPAETGLPPGVLRGEAHGVTAFFTESFVDELAARSGLDPLSFRMGLLGDAPRLAQCLTTVATLGGWQGGAAGTPQGLACHAAYGSFVAVLAEARVEGSAILVDRLSCAVDCGRLVNPDLVRQQIEGGLLFALPAAIGAGLPVAGGLPVRRRLHQAGIPTLAHAPEIRVELIASHADPGGVSGLAVSVVAPAIANAIAAATGHRSRSLPLSAA